MADLLDTVVLLVQHQTLERIALMVAQAELPVDLHTPSNQTTHTPIVDMAFEKLASKAHPCLGQTNSVRGTNYQAHRVYY